MSMSEKKLRDVLGEDYEKVKPYLHHYNGKAESVKPVAKSITIYYIARAADRLTIRTEGEDDIILSEIVRRTVPTIIFRKLKAVYLRMFMELARLQWAKHEGAIKGVWFPDVNFINSCSLAVGLVAEKGAMLGRCMKCPVDVLMGATSAREEYNLVSRFVGDAAYALSSDFEKRLGIAVDEVSHTTIMLTGGEKEARVGERTGGVYSMAFVPPGTLFVGKVVLFMPSPPELLYSLWLLSRPIRAGARTSVQGTLEVVPVALIGDLYEVGTAYEASERAYGKADLAEAKEVVLKYVESEAYSSGSGVVKIDERTLGELAKLDVLDGELVKELWESAKKYVDGVVDYVGVGKTKAKKGS